MRIKRYSIDWSFFIFCFSSVGKGEGEEGRGSYALDPISLVIFGKKKCWSHVFYLFYSQMFTILVLCGSIFDLLAIFYHFCSLKTAVRAQMSDFFSKCFRKCSPIPPTGTFIFRSFTFIILKFGIQDFTDPGLLKIRLTLTGLSLSVFKNQGAFAITTTKATQTLLTPWIHTAYLKNQMQILITFFIV